MQAEKQDELWRKAMEQMDHLPEGVSFNTANTWRKLEHQLQPSASPVIKSNPFYYAAACVVVAAVVGGIWLSGKPAHETPAVSAPVKSVLTAAPIVVSSPVKTKSTPVIKRNTYNPTILIQDTIAQNPVHTNIDTIAIIPVVVQPANNNDITAASAPATAAPPKNTATIKTRNPRKFAVVHINDLVTNTPELPPATSKKTIQQQPEEIDNTTPPEAPKSWWLSKPKVVNTISLTENPN